MKTNQKGFSVVEILILLVVIGVICGAGFYIWSQKNDNAGNSTISQTQPSDQARPESCNTSNEDQKTWKVAASHESSFNMCVPGGWTLISDTGSELFTTAPPFAIASSKDAVIKSEEIGGKDGTSDSFQVFKAKESYQGWTSSDAEKNSFTLNDGTEGTRYYTKHMNVGEGIGPIEGEEDYEYLFEKNGKFIHAVYTIHPGTQKQLETIESVLKTLVIK